MGVRGIRHLLQNVGWLDQSVSEGNVDPAEAKTYGRTPLPCGCAENIWKEYNASDTFLGNHNMPPLERIPPNALFLIDGNGRSPAALAAAAGLV